MAHERSDFFGKCIEQVAVLRERRCPERERLGGHLDKRRAKAHLAFR